MFVKVGGFILLLLVTANGEPSQLLLNSLPSYCSVISVKNKILATVLRSLQAN
jgi:hypothetical protein